MPGTPDASEAPAPLEANASTDTASKANDGPAETPPPAEPFTEAASAADNAGTAALAFSDAPALESPVASPADEPPFRAEAEPPVVAEAPNGALVAGEPPTQESVPDGPVPDAPGPAGEMAVEIEPGDTTQCETTPLDSLITPAGAMAVVDLGDTIAQPAEASPVPSLDDLGPPLINLREIADIARAEVTPAPSEVPPPAEGTSVPEAAGPQSVAAASAAEAPAAGHGPMIDVEKLKELLRLSARYGAYALGGYLALVAVLLVVYRFANPPASTLMAYQWMTGTSISQDWVPLEDISPHLIRSVVVSEDGRFCEHWGIDLGAIKEAIQRSRESTPRGASTLSMQVVKNVFLWPSKSYLRKALEVPITLGMELAWPKRRILEVYLNVAEWGPGIFGAEAAARHHFKKSAAQLSSREAALLAASLPNPIVRNAGKPGSRTARKAGIIQSRVRSSGGLADCVLSTLAGS